MEPKIQPFAKADTLLLPLAINSLHILSMDACALKDRIQMAFLENPLLEPAHTSVNSEMHDYIYAKSKQVISLREDLHQQIGYLSISKKLSILSNLLVDYLDDDGYLREDISELSKERNISVASLEEALSVVQSLEPAGVGCRNLSECLKLQLVALDSQNELALDIVTNHLEELANNTFPIENYDIDYLSEAMELIQSLSPHPCSGFGTEQIQYIVPDIHIYVNEDGDLASELINQPTAPTLSPLYLNYLKADSVEDRSYIRAKINAAQNFIYSISMRTQTMSRIAQFLITQQKDFFLYGPDKQRPITITILAESLGLSISTVSRAVAGKYVEYNGEVFPLRKMFYHNGTGDFSREAIILRIQSLLKKDPSLSDNEISVLLKAQGINISRRTVNKYKHLSGNV